MGTFGENMQREREMRGISLEEIALSTKIGVRSLQALEQEEFEKLPGGIFNKGFVRAYARYLGIDEEQAVADFQAARSEKVPAPFGQSLQKVYQTQPVEESHYGIIALGVALLLLIGGLAFLGWRQHWAQAVMHKISAGRDTPAAPAPGPEATPPPAASDAGAVTDSGVAPAAAALKSPGTSAASSGPSGAGASPPASGKDFIVEVQASRPSWISVTSDGKQLMKGVLHAGEQKSFAAGDRVIIKTQNPKALKIVRDGETIPVPDSESRTKTVVVLRQGSQGDNPH